MTFEQIWAQLCRKRPSLEKQDATFECTSGNLKALLRQVYEQGQNSAPPTDRSASIFGSVFGDHN